jgi:hypothetical protein
LASGSSWKLNIAATGMADNRIRWCAHVVDPSDPHQWLLMFDVDGDTWLTLGVGDSQDQVYALLFLEDCPDRGFPFEWDVDDYSPWQH